MESAVGVDVVVDSLHDAAADDPVVEARYNAVVGAAVAADNDDSATQAVESHTVWVPGVGPDYSMM